MREAVIVAGSRTAVGVSNKGMTRNLRADEMAAAVVRDLLQRTRGKLDPAQIDDLVLGCAFPEGPQGMNLARPVAILSGLPVEVPAHTVNRFCSSGLQAIAAAANSIIADQADIVIAGGVESMSSVPMKGFRPSPNLGLVERMPQVYMGMGLTAEQVAVEFDVSRQAQDEFAYQSQMKAAAAVDAGRFKDEIVTLEWEEVAAGENGELVRKKVVFDLDEHPRPSTTIEGLARLRPVFKPSGSVTAGNSSPLSDGAAAVLLMEAKTALRLRLEPLARFISFGVAGVRPEIMGVGPIIAIPRVLKRTGLKLADIDIIELNEAFAVQSVAVMRELDLNPAVVNVNGGAIALGHPLGCTGAKLTVQAVNELRRRKAKYCMVMMCIGGGMGAAGIFENLSS